MGAASSHGPERANRIFGNYIERYRAEEGGGGGNLHESIVTRGRGNLLILRAPYLSAPDYQAMKKVARAGRGELRTRLRRMSTEDS